MHAFVAHFEWKKICSVDIFYKCIEFWSGMNIFHKKFLLSSIQESLEWHQGEA